jgi:hypothetical protein
MKGNAVCVGMVLYPLIPPSPLLRTGSFAKGRSFPAMTNGGKKESPDFIGAFFTRD